MQQALRFPPLQIPSMSALPIMAMGNTALTAIDSNSVRSLLTQSSLVGKELTPIPTAAGRALMALPDATSGQLTGADTQQLAAVFQPSQEQRAMVLQDAKLWSELPKVVEPAASTRDLVLDSAQKNGLSEEEFLELMRKPASALTDIEKIKMENIRNAVPMPDETTVLQKVISAEQFDFLMSESFVERDERASDVRGYFATVESVAELNTPRELFEELRLDYDNTPFSPSDESAYVLRFTAGDVSEIQIPYGDNMPHPAGRDISEMAYPATGNGFLASENGSLIPEWYSTGLQINDGAEIYAITNSGKDLVAVYDKDTRTFNRVNSNINKDGEKSQ
jgi:hypothetical protein